MRLSMLLGRIALSDRHLAEAEERISQQRLRVASSTGVENARALSVLNKYLGNLEQLQIYRSILDEDLRLCRAGA